MFEEHKSLMKRSKRAVLPIVGKVLSFLFGTLSSEDLDSIRRNVNVLAQNKQKITHVLQESLSILNVSRIEVAENRKSVNELLFMIFTIIFNEIIFNLDRHVAMIQSLKDCLVWLLKLDFILNIYKCSSTS